MSFLQPYSAANALPSNIGGGDVGSPGGAFAVGSYEGGSSIASPEQQQQQQEQEGKFYGLVPIRVGLII